MTKAKQTIQDAREACLAELCGYEQEGAIEAVLHAFDLLADIEAGKVRVVPVEATLGLMPLHMYEAMLKAAPPHEAETYLKGLK